MFNFIKFIFKTVVAVLLILLGIIAAIGIFIDPNDYKDKISIFLANKTGYKLKINGPINWSVALNKSFGFEVQNLKIDTLNLDLQKIFILVNPLKSLLNRKLILETKIFNETYKFIWEGESNVDIIAKNVEITSSNIEYNNTKYNLKGDLNYQNAKVVGNIQVELFDNISLNTKFILDAQQIEFNSLLIKLGVGNVSGNIKISFVNHLGEFDLKIKNIGAMQIIDAMMFARSSKLLQKLKLTGRVHGDELLITPHLNFTNIDLYLENTKPGMFEINNGVFYLGKASVNVDFKADFKTEVNQKPIFEFTVNTKNLEMPRVSKIFSAGVGILNLKLSTTADNYRDLLHNLTGNIDLVVANGGLNGIDCYNILTKTEDRLNDIFSALLKNPNQDAKLLLSNHQQTMENIDNLLNTGSDFSVLKLQALLKNGVDPKSSIVLKNQKYSMQGYGIIDLPKNYLNYQTFVQFVATPSALVKEIPQYMQVYPIMINADGAIDNIVLSTDLNKYFLTAISVLQKIAIKNKESNIVSGQMEEVVTPAY